VPIAKHADARSTLTTQRQPRAQNIANAIVLDFVPLFSNDW